ncbi:hypothetical protein CH253_17860 [Rhodococcus sp. 06-156-3C]|uniref:hypothetical protein n=1 Tax=Nocardiaceae TaxID=85025 RepID=UPI000522F87D|nr:MULTISPECIES: hypothetical protein [Rhodococcus]OZD18326.1 hypothetical protein CH280_07185 [Rhodococcus sp. 06-156-4C]OZD18924.1 hypothetical protein CH253_17860 [Rhodococcus sp. 06-156-3C]OZD22434.1 hypothetical protein CH248_09445 [Rhodococcus sp. 06-156-4a]OZD34018.1 hypothetical protein CH247_07975 [Rhodococcus sp. 06-156-3b]OZD38755.1 hypothetical protein CH284_06395 [Rhodococcus sp. 06-156-3]
MGTVNISAWLLVFVAVLAFGAAGIRLALAPHNCFGPMDRASKTLSVIGGVGALAVTAIRLLPLDAAF